ncbi:MAG TPA: hypothetical protein VF789_18530 [Thermoanaerobaculia bacterium]
MSRLMTPWSLGTRVAPSYLRTSGGLEVDLLLERQEGILAFEFKSRPRVDARNATGLERARLVLGDRYRGGIVVYQRDQVLRLSETVFAVSDWVLLG